MLRPRQDKEAQRKHAFHPIGGVNVYQTAHRRGEGTGFSERVASFGQNPSTQGIGREGGVAK